MKDYARILEKTRRDRLQQIYSPKELDVRNEWDTLQEIELFARRMQKRLEAVMDGNYLPETQHVKFDFHDPPQKGSRCLIKAQFYRLGPRELLLKVFAHQLTPRGSTSRLARARYHFRLSPVLPAA